MLAVLDRASKGSAVTVEKARRRSGVLRNEVESVGEWREWVVEVLGMSESEPGDVDEAIGSCLVSV